MSTQNEQLDLPPSSGVTKSLLLLLLLLIFNLFWGGGVAMGGTRPLSGGRGQEDGNAVMHCAHSKVKLGVNGASHGVNEGGGGGGGGGGVYGPPIVTPLPPS